MSKPVVTIGVAAYGGQPPTWWQHTAVMVSKLPEYGIEIGGIIVASSMAADYNRNDIADRFLKGRADYLLWIDTDNIIPFGGVKRLLEAGKELISGLYHLKKPPYNPIAYWRQSDNNGYEPIHHFRPGELVPVDMAGMGACLVHRNTFEEIQKQYRVVVRHNGSVFPVHVDDIGGEMDSAKPPAPKVVDGCYIEPVRYLTEKDRERPFPFFYLEHGRTEDVVFYEMAKRCGIQPFVDTGVEVGHVGSYEYEPKDYRNHLRTLKEEWKREQDWIELLRQEGLMNDETQAAKDS